MTTNERRFMPNGKHISEAREAIEHANQVRKKYEAEFLGRYGVSAKSAAGRLIKAKEEVARLEAQIAEMARKKTLRDERASKRAARRPKPHTAPHGEPQLQRLEALEATMQAILAHLTKPGATP